jgi:hypothetical protein
MVQEYIIFDMYMKDADRSPRPAQPIGYWLKRLDQLIDANFDRTLGAENLSRRHWQLLNLLKQQPAGHAELSTALAPFLLDDLDVTTVSNELLQRGWVSAEDGRLQLTESGHLAHGAILEKVAGARRKTVQGISDAEYLATIDVLQRMAANLDDQVR